MKTFSKFLISGLFLMLTFNSFSQNRTWRYNPDLIQVSVVGGVIAYDPFTVAGNGLKGWDGNDWMINVQFGLDFSRRDYGLQLTYVMTANMVNLTSRVRIPSNIFRRRR